MLFFETTRSGNPAAVTRVLNDAECREARRAEIATNIAPPFFDDRNDFKSFATAEAYAARATELTGKLHIPTDSGAHVSPRYDVIEAPEVGDDVSYAFNGDSYPCGKIVKISESMRRIETHDEKRGKRVFYRRGQSAAWIADKTWSLVPGHVYTQNPSF